MLPEPFRNWSFVRIDSEGQRLVVTPLTTTQMITAQLSSDNRTRMFIPRRLV